MSEAANSTEMSQSDVVVYGIKKMIVDGKLAPGNRLPIEKDLAVVLGVSRSSLREGVRALSIMGVLETRQGAGTYVTSLDASLLLAPMAFVVDLQSSKRAANLHSVRRVLETEAAGLAAEAMSPSDVTELQDCLDRMAAAMKSGGVGHEEIMATDVEFHRLIAAKCGNPVLSALIEALASQTVRGRLWRAISDDHAEQRTLSEHQAILNALKDGAVERARLRMANHLLDVEEFLHERPVEPDVELGTAAVRAGAA